MKLMFTSFGLPEPQRRFPTYRAPRARPDQPLFSRMPPVAMQRLIHVFTPEYPVLLLCDKIVLDTATFTRLQNKPHPYYALMAETMNALYAEGFIDLADYEDILTRNSDLLDRMLDNDLRLRDQWLEPFGDSIVTWFRFANQVRDELGKDPYPYGADYELAATLLHMGNNQLGTILAALRSLQGPDLPVSQGEDADWLWGYLIEPLQSYLSYVNANLVISNELGIGFYDWKDFAPFYRQKFLSVGRDDLENEQLAEASRELFEASFPRFAIESPKQLLKIMTHKRVGELRALVHQAAQGGAVFDRQFADSVFQEVIDTERRIGGYRKLISYLTLPVGFIPWVGSVAEKAVGWPADAIVERKLRRKYRWFYMLSDLRDE